MLNITVTLTGYPTRALTERLTAPIAEGGTERLTRIATADPTGGTYQGVVLAGGLYETEFAELAAFFQAIPASAYGVTQGIVCVDDTETDGINVNRIGWVPNVVPARG